MCLHRPNSTRASTSAESVRTRGGGSTALATRKSSHDSNNNYHHHHHHPHQPHSAPTHRRPVLTAGESRWNSLPLVLALLPAVAEIFSRNGSSIITDVTLLALASIFLNWSVKFPW